MDPTKPDVTHTSFNQLDVQLNPTIDAEDLTANQEHKRAVHIDHNLIGSIPDNLQLQELQDLGLTVYNQEQFEEGVIAQVEEAISKDEEIRTRQNLESNLVQLKKKIRDVSREVDQTERRISALTSQRIPSSFKTVQDLDSKLSAQNQKLGDLKKEKQSTEDYLSGKSKEIPTCCLGQNLSELLQPSENDELIRLGEKTPFGTVLHGPTSSTHSTSTLSAQPSVSGFEKYLLEQAKSSSLKSRAPGKPMCSSTPIITSGISSSSKLKKHISHSSGISTKPQGNRFDDANKLRSCKSESDMSKLASKKRKVKVKVKHKWEEDGELSDWDDADVPEEQDDGSSDGDWMPHPNEGFSDEASLSQDKTSRKDKKSKSKSKSQRLRDLSSDEEVGKQKNEVKKKCSANRQATDDGNEKAYKRRLLQYECDKQSKMETGDWESDAESDAEFDGGFKVPGHVWKKLYKYQKTGVRWLWELHCQRAGGVLGDEMGLGKTIQAIAFLMGLQYSGLRERLTVPSLGGDSEAVRYYKGLGPVLIVCPATVLHQWVKEIHLWWPRIRVAVLHNSGSYSGSTERLVGSMLRCNGVIVAAYSSVLIHQDLLIPQAWHYVILDEGHKIRNPDAQITIACKQLKTHHRIILSGSPMQNNLKELWSLFDFVFPGKLGTLPEFMQHVSVPIVQGGYSNATQIQVQTAYKCACMLRDTISPYLLRRMKADVQECIQLPAKNEQVLFCRLTPEQRDVYKEYLGSKECQMILGGRFMVFPGLITLRKICNHPDICTGGLGVAESMKEGPVSTEVLRYGHHSRSGKMTVIMSLLKIWKKQQHRVLLFSQSRMMLDILESFVQGEEYTYLRMDGSTPIGARQPLIQSFNQDAEKFIFLLTTRVGGLGVNLTGANRVVIYDPDWNPSTDTQARERAWRIGQRKDVTVYRLLTAGTIEEKIYHRQIFKQFLANRVLKDPRQRRFFKSNDLFELFTLTDDSPNLATETSAIFAGTGSNINIKNKKGRKNRFDEMKNRNKLAEEESVELVEELGLVDDGEKDAGSGATTGIPGKPSSSAPGPDETVRKKLLWDLARKLSQQMNGKKDLSENDSGLPVVDKPGASTSKRRASTPKAEIKDKDHRKSRKHKSRRRHDARFEGEKVPLLAKQGEYKPDGASEEKQATSNSNDEYVLQKLFKKAGIHSALKHDNIMEAGQPDFALVEAEAAKVATQAARALKQSRSECMRALRSNPGLPTWTGREGAAGAPQPKLRFGQKRRAAVTSCDAIPEKKAKEADKMADSASQSVVTSTPSQRFNGESLLTKSTSDSNHEPLSSSQLLSRMRDRKVESDPSSAEDSDEMNQPITRPRSSVPPAAQHMELITDIRNFVAFGAATDGKASTQEIMDKFKEKVSPLQTPHFKAMLRQICHHDRTGGFGVWILKREFK